MNKRDLVCEIQQAFRDVRLGEGIGLWQAQGIDDYASETEILELRKKDEKNNWDNIKYEDLSICESSLSFFDAKGMRFHLPKFLIFDILEEEISKENDIQAPEVLFTISNDLDSEYQQARFSLFNPAQLKSVIAFLKYKLENRVDNNSIYSSAELIEVIEKWKRKLNK